MVHRFFYFASVAIVDFGLLDDCCLPHIIPEVSRTQRGLGANLLRGRICRQCIADPSHWRAKLPLRSDDVEPYAGTVRIRFSASRKSNSKGATAPPAPVASTPPRPACAV